MELQSYLKEFELEPVPVDAGSSQYESPLQMVLDWADDLCGHPVPAECVLSHNMSTDRVVPLAGEVLESPESCEKSVIPASSAYPGPVQFNVDVDGSARYLKLEEERLLVINRFSKFAVSFGFGVPPPRGCVVEAMVMCEKTADVERLGAVHRCKKHLQMEGPGAVEEFLLAHNHHVRYGYQGAHQVTAVPLDAMMMREDVYTCTYSCSCYSSCFFGRGNLKSRLIIVFSLLSRDGECLGRAVLHFRCCAGPSRDAEKKKKKKAVIATRGGRKRAAQTPSGANGRKRARSVSQSSTSSCCSGDSSPSLSGDTVDSPPSSTSTADSSVSFPATTGLTGSPPVPLHSGSGDLLEELPDEEGYFTFTWKLKDKLVFNMLKTMKRGHEKMMQ